MKLRVIALILNLCVVSVLLSQVNNPFDIQRTDTLEPSEEVIPVPPAGEQTKIADENPFSVSHIPIRQNQYDQIERLKSVNTDAEESISIGYLPLWVTAFSMCLLAFILVTRKQHLLSLIRSVFNNNLMRLTANEESNGLSFIYLGGYILFLINIALFVFLAAGKAFSVQMTYGYFTILLIMTVFFWGKHLVLSVFSRLYEFEKEALVYGFTISTLYNLLSLVFLSLNILLLFGPENWVRPLALLGLSVFLFFLVSRYYKGLYIGRKYLNGSFFHFFLYFCAFELSPWILVYSLFRDLI